MGKLIIFSAPSGSGKTTIVRELLRRIPQLEFSISATSRAPRGTERDGVDYYFLSPDEFRRAVDEERFVEWEEVYAGTCYGTLRSELDRIWGKGHTILFDVDVLGGINLKRIFGADACSVFIMPPSIEELERRLELRATDAPRSDRQTGRQSGVRTDQGARIRPRRRQRRAGHGRGGGRTHRARLSAA